METWELATQLRPVLRSRTRCYLHALCTPPKRDKCQLSLINLYLVNRSKNPG